MTLSTSSTLTLTELNDPSSPAYKKARRQYLKSTRNRDSSAGLDWTPFRAAEKRYKARFPPPDLSDVVDLRALVDAKADEVVRGGWRVRPNVVECKELAPKRCCSSKIFTVPRIPGRCAECSRLSISRTPLNSRVLQD